MAQPVWVTPAGPLEAPIPEGVFFQKPLEAYEPTVILTPTTINATGLEVTLGFPKQNSVPYEVGTEITLSDFSPAGFNGTYTVTRASNNSVSFANVTLPTKLVVKSLSSSGTTVTLQLPPMPNIPYEIGSRIALAGFVPSSYNGVYTVTDATNSSVSFSSTNTSAIITLGTVTNSVPGTVVNVVDPVFYELIAGSLPAGMQIQQTGLINGIPKATVNVQGVPEEVSRDVTSKFAVRAYTRKMQNGIIVINRLADRTFTLTVTGQDVPQWITPAGQIAQYFDGTLVTDLQVEYSDTDPDDIVEVSLVAGNLPPGLSISKTGLITGLIRPVSPIGAEAGFSRDGQGYDMFPFDFTTQGINQNYEFVLEVSDGKVGGSSLRTFSIFIYSRSLMTADTDLITADNSFITADSAPGYIPVLTNPQGSIGTVRNDNWFAYKFNAVDFDGDVTQYIISSSSPTPLSTVGLTLDINTGWLYGYIPDLGIINLLYTFSIRVYKETDPTYISPPYTYTLEITGPIDTEIFWETNQDLGTIVNGSISTLFVKAVNRVGIELNYELLSGSNSSLPQGLSLLPSGDIAGRVSFDTFALDGGTTTFDVTKQNGQRPTTFDLTYKFTVRAYSVNGLISVNKMFEIRVIREFNEPYENLYIKCMPPKDDRALIDSLLQNSDIFPPNLIYRPQDPYFGVATDIIYNHAYGLTASTIADYYSALYKNHYWKNLILGSIKTARALDANGNVKYEVVYSQIVDDLVNNQGQSVSKEVNLPYPVSAELPYPANPPIVSTDVVYPNSLVNMRDQVIDVVGQISNILPDWMTSQQKDGRVLGFVPAWVIAYVKPGQAERVAYYIQQQFGENLNLVDFEVDRYELDRSLTKNWDPVYDSTVGSWIPNPPELTTFDVEPHYQLPEPNDSSFVFDGGVDYAIGDQIKILGSLIGGQDNLNDVIITVQEVDENGTILQAQAVGFAVLNTVGETYINISGTNISGIGTGATWDLIVVGQDPTVFDGGSMEFTAPVDMYGAGDQYDKYLVFPKRTILG